MANASDGPTVAVWPFENDTGDGGLDALADGLTRQIISALGRFGELRVLARSVTKSYKDRFESAATSVALSASIISSKAI